MIKKVRIAVDHGNRNMKTCSQVFTTGLTIQDKKPARGEKFLFYEGKYYVLSENRIPYQRDKTQDDRFFILTLFAIVKELEENPQIQPGDVIQVDLTLKVITVAKSVGKLFTPNCRATLLSFGKVTSTTS